MMKDATMTSERNNSLTGKVALLTGAGRGIGKACAVMFAEAGAKVIAVARTQSDLDLLAADYPGLIETWTADVLDPALAARVEGLSRLDILVNNAGGNKPEPFTDVTPETLNSIMALNVTAPFLLAQAAVRVMLREKIKGAIVNMSSQMGHVGSPRRTVYCATKHAIEGLTKAMAVELAPHGIRVNAVAPTFIETPLTAPMLADPAFRSFVLDKIPLGHMGQVSDVAEAVFYLASPAAAMVTGHSLVVDGGWTAQ
jgi:NAD(P)-dependent dehydrogenase (short-subunit alcohol dehydrogenase family)